MVANSRSLESLATRPLPPPFGAHLRMVTAITDNMCAAAAAIGVHRKFTPDGRFLGDIGEVIAKIHFGLTLHGAQRKGEDGTCVVSGKSVEVKLRSNSSLVWVKDTPDILLVIYLSPATLRWGIVCNGPGRHLLATARWNPGESRHETTLNKLLTQHQSLAPHMTGIAELSPAIP